MKLYLNAYLISRAFGGPEEGGWHYDIGIPLASLPLEARRVETGEACHITHNSRERITFLLEACFACDKETREMPCGEAADSETGQCVCKLCSPCEYCGIIPQDVGAAQDTANSLWKQLKGDATPRYERVELRLEQSFAAPWPKQRPRYE